MDFHEALKEFDGIVEQVFQERGERYNNAGIEIPMYFPHGLSDYLYELRKKILRADSEMSIHNTQIYNRHSADVYIEHFRDIVNYARFAGAYAVERKAFYEGSDHPTQQRPELGDVGGSISPLSGERDRSSSGIS